MFISYIQGYTDENGRRISYIVAQSPFDDLTALDMWRMIYQHSTKTVVIMSRVIEDGVLKCLQYWPDNGKTESGPFKVRKFVVYIRYEKQI